MQTTSLLIFCSVLHSDPPQPSPYHRGRLGDTAPPPLCSRIRKIIELEQTPLYRLYLFSTSGATSSSSAADGQSRTRRAKLIYQQTGTYEPPHKHTSHFEFQTSKVFSDSSSFRSLFRAKFLYGSSEWDHL